MSVAREDFQRIRSKMLGLFSNTGPELKTAGKAAAEQIVTTTLAGIGEGDQAFAPYSDAYRRLLASVGGKPGGVVNLRGVLYHEGQRRPRSPRPDRRGKPLVEFGTVENAAAGGRVRFSAPQTRPMRGVNDPLSEMSLDLLKVEASDEALAITYRPRLRPYMLRHNAGDDRMPRRPWFTANKTAVRAALWAAVTATVAARVRRFNER